MNLRQHWATIRPESSQEPGTDSDPYVLVGPHLTRKGKEVWAKLQTHTDLELPLDSPFASLTEVHLGFVVFGHHLHKLPGQDGVLGFPDAQVCGRAGHILFNLALHALQLVADTVGPFLDFRRELLQVILGFWLWNGCGQNDTVELFGLLHMF